MSPKIFDPSKNAKENSQSFKNDASQNGKVEI
jgi:hypothetical protein